MDDHVIGNAELARFLEALERERVSNPITEEDAETDSKRLIHREGLKNILRLGGFDLKRLVEWVRRTIEAGGVVKIKRDDTRSETQDTHQKIEFIPIEPGRFQMGDEGEKFEVTLTHPFEVMSTLVTQKQWVEVMGENPSKFLDGEHTITVTVGGKSLKMQPDNPVENVTWWAVLEYANRLSQKHGLRPAYDFSQITFKKGTRAEDGTLDVERGDLKINALGGNIYEAQGYRLPTEAEQEYLLRGGGKSNGRYHFGNNEADLKDYGWSNENSNRATHSVAQLKPAIINGNQIYDLHGNVWEWGQDWFAGFSRSAATDPSGPPTGNSRVLRGGSWGNDPGFLRSAWRYDGHPDRRHGDVGFRVVRTLP